MSDSVLSHLDLGPFVVFLVVLVAAFLVRAIAGSTARSRSLLVGLALGLSLGAR